MMLRSIALATATVLTLAACAASKGSSARRGPSVHETTYVSTAGPALAGRSVTWAERYGDGSIALIRRRGDSGRASVQQRISGPTGPGRSVHISGLPGGLSAVSRRVAFGLDSCLTRQDSSDSATTDCTSVPYVTSRGSELERLLPQCQAGGSVVTSGHGALIAIGQGNTHCDGSGQGSRVWLIQPDGVSRMLYEAAPSTSFGQVRLAGRWIAWIEDDDSGRSIRVTDRRSGHPIATLRASDLGGRRDISEFDLDRRGRVVGLVGCPGSRNICLGLSSRSRGEGRLLSRNASYNGVAISEGRVAFLGDQRQRDDALILKPIRRGSKRVIARFSKSEELTGEIAMRAGRLAWATVTGRRDDGTLGKRGTVRNVRIGR